MKKYWQVFRLSLRKRLQYRLDFFLNQLRNVVIFLLMYTVWTSITNKASSFAGYTQKELITYVFGMLILHGIVLGLQSRETATEINDGTFSTLLVRPINHFWYVFFRELPERMMAFFTSLVSLGILFFFLRFNIVITHSGVTLFAFLVSVVLATILYFSLSYSISLFAFWSREANGPRFLYEWILQFCSGEYFPIHLFVYPVFIVLSVLPFAYTTYYPMVIYLQKVPSLDVLRIIFIQTIWIIIASFLARAVWRAGLKKFTAEGI